jgi:hypothetical protein
VTSTPGYAAERSSAWKASQTCTAVSVNARAAGER